MTKCRICLAPLGPPDYAAPAPALTDGGSLIDVTTEVSVCASCGLAQSPDLPDIARFYRDDYKELLGDETRDQIVSLADGRSLFRTDVQLEAVLRMADPPPNARVLDYGAGNGVTLRKLTAKGPDITPYLFDVSDDYRDSWATWANLEHCATHETPAQWAGLFDLVTCHFVMEHVVEVRSLLTHLRSLLRPDGRLFLSVPNSLANPGDLLVVDHLSHFTRGSLKNAFAVAGLRLQQVDTEAFPGALLSMSSPTAPATIEPDAELSAMRHAAADWTVKDRALREAARRNGAKPAAIYGAGFYGSFIRTTLGQDANVRCFLDANPQLQGTTHMGLPVTAPSDIPADVRVVYAGLNPIKARAIIATQPSLADREIVYLGDRADT